jgi:3-oxoacyl-[acyl-carrier protein] reductase
VTDSPSGQFQGRVALITGASRGIGASAARRFAERGTAVVLAARGEDALANLEHEIAATGGTALAIPTDLTDIAAVDQLIDRLRAEHGRLDVLVNNAAVFPPRARLERTSVDDWRRIIDLNLTAPWYLATRCKELMDGGSVVINIASPAALFPTVGFGPYSITKAALNMLTRAAALEWARDGIRVVGIIPGWTDTDMAAPIVAALAERGIPVSPLGRMNDPREVADLMVYLASEKARQITGAIIPIDGGYTIVAPG